MIEKSNPGNPKQYRWKSHTCFRETKYSAPGEQNQVVEWWVQIFADMFEEGFQWSGNGDIAEPLIYPQAFFRQHVDPEQEGDEQDDDEPDGLF